MVLSSNRESPMDKRENKLPNLNVERSVLSSHNNRIISGGQKVNSYITKEDKKPGSKINSPTPRLKLSFDQEQKSSKFGVVVQSLKLHHKVSSN